MATTDALVNLAAQAAGNHMKFESFGWHDQPEDPWNWVIVYTHNRDSKILDLSNAAVIAEEMKPFIESEDAYEEHHRHWAVGWVEGYSIRVYREDGSITDAFRKWAELQQQLEDHPALDEADISARELVEEANSVECQMPSNSREDLPDDWIDSVLSWFCDQGVYPVENWYSQKEIEQAMDALGFLEDGDE